MAKQIQSLQEHLRIANPVDPRRKKIYLLILEIPFPDDDTLAAVRRYLNAFFGLEVQLSYAHWQSMPLATRLGRAGFGSVQLSMDDLLTWLKFHVPSDAYCLVAITTLDLFAAGSSCDYIPGRSHYTQRHGAFSLARLGSEVVWEFKPCGLGKYLRRCLKLSSHEVAHTFGLKHCINQTCRMVGTMSLEHHDATNLVFCHSCEQKLCGLLRWSERTYRRRASYLAKVLQSLSGTDEFCAEVQAWAEVAGESMQSSSVKR